MKEFESCDYVFKESSGKVFVSTPEPQGLSAIGAIMLVCLVGWVLMFLALGGF